MPLTGEPIASAERPASVRERRVLWLTEPVHGAELVVAVRHGDGGSPAGR